MAASLGVILMAAKPPEDLLARFSRLSAVRV
jgi:hypothetical protein